MKGLDKFIVTANQSTIDIVDQFSFDEKMKLWLSYMVNQVSLNNVRPLCEINAINKIYFSKNIDYPIFSMTLGATQNLPIISFDDFCNSKEYELIWDYSKFYTGHVGIYTNIYNYYERTEM